MAVNSDAGSGPSNKVVAQATSAVIAGAVCTLVFWLLSQYAHVDPPNEVKEAVVLLVAVGIGALKGYLQPENNPAPSAQRVVERRLRAQGRLA